MNISSTAIIRDRGQLTIPDKIRDFLGWTQPQSVVTIRTTKAKEIIITPFDQKKETNWDTIWANLKKVRSFKGKGDTDKPLSQFIIEDRQRH